MNQDQQNSSDHLMSSNDLAFERTVMAENRTLMAWIRTAISLISFGFTIYKFFHEISQSTGPSHRLLTPRKVGMIMISFGLLSLLWGIMEYKGIMKKLKRSYPSLEGSKTSWLAILVLLFGLLLLIGTAFRQ